jgi:parvulin-like peptidyl-prolyl isomerase
MHELNTVAVTVDGVCLSLGDWLTHLKRRGPLLPLLREAALDRLLTQQASEAGLTVSDAELQAAADTFRRRQGLSSAADTHAWLCRQGLTAENLEQSLEADLLAEKFKEHLTRDRIVKHFAAHRDDYAGAQLRLIVVDREDFARELLAQIFDEGREFAALAREHSLHLSQSEGGQLGLVLRRQLPASIADAVFAAREGEVVGPLATPQGFQLFLVEARRPATLDRSLTALIQQELFDAWVHEQLSDSNLRVPLIEAL